MTGPRLPGCRHSRHLWRRSMRVYSPKGGPCDNRRGYRVKQPKIQMLRGTGGTPHADIWLEHFLPGALDYSGDTEPSRAVLVKRRKSRKGEKKNGGAMQAGARPLSRAAVS